MTETKQLNCDGCSFCCEHVVQTFTPIAELIEFHETWGREVYIIPELNMGCIVEKMPCQHLDSNGRCDDYENRPQACREFPSASHPIYHPHCAIMRDKFKIEE